MKANYLAIVALCGVAALAGDGPFELSRHSIDAGGIVGSTGGEFELSGTIGQPDAGVLNGGEFILTGGFWLSLLPTDCNEDGATTIVDHSQFVACSTGPGGGPPLPECRCFDVDRNGAVDLQDYAFLQEIFAGN